MLEGFQLFKAILSGLWAVIKGLWFLAVPPLIFIILFLVFVFYFYIKEVYVNHRKPQKRLRIPKKDGFLKKIFIMAPHQIVNDLIEQDLDAFDKFGVHIICGEQGAGKTITAVYLMNEWKRMYPKCIINTNFEVKGQDGYLDSPADLFRDSNGIYGVVNCIDELQTWWSNSESAKMPPKILGEISQQRKQKKATIGTVQCFKRLSKAFREQAHFVYEPRTFLNCITIVRCTKGKYFNENTEEFKRYTGFFFFVHTKELRNSYDTYKKIEKYKDFNWEMSLYTMDAEAPQEHASGIK